MQPWASQAISLEAMDVITWQSSDFVGICDLLWPLVNLDRNYMKDKELMEPCSSLHDGEQSQEMINHVPKD